MATGDCYPMGACRKRTRRGSCARMKAPINLIEIMTLSVLITSGVWLAVYPYSLRREGLKAARTNAFATPVSADILRSFGCRSDTKPLWLMWLLGDRELLGVAVAVIVFRPWTP